MSISICLCFVVCLCVSCVCLVCVLCVSCVCLACLAYVLRMSCVCLAYVLRVLCASYVRLMWSYVSLSQAHVNTHIHTHTTQCLINDGSRRLKQTHAHTV